MSDQLTGLEVAVVGMSCKFPDSNSVEEYWNNLKSGNESISFLSEEELKRVDINVSSHPNYVNVKGGIINQPYLFDEGFFGYTPNEAKVMDPQVRLMHELIWEALEDAGYNSFDYKGSIGLYASATQNTYWEVLAASSPESEQIGSFAANNFASKESIGTLIAYKLNLRGPVVFLSSACSTSLVAIHSAARALLGGECTMALAGGVAIPAHPSAGYVYQQGMVLSSDGHCRAFDENSNGTIAGQGGGVVLLKLLEDAIKDGDNIHAVIKGSAINNDGAQKIGYTAPSFQGQEKVIKSALQMAEVSPESIGYVEAHGTGTILGDPIEIQALTSAYNTEKKGYCAIGSVKTNIGHTDIAAGVAGFIKVVLSLKNKKLVPSLNFKSPNPKIKFDESPFFVNTELKKWYNEGESLRAAVSSFGIGGTNAHVILEEYCQNRVLESGNYNIVSLSARSKSALEQQAANLTSYFTKNSVSLNDVCYTLHLGRKHHEFRKSIVIDNKTNILQDLESSDKWHLGTALGNSPSSVFMLSGQGTQYLGYGKELYQAFPVFRAEIDTCAEIIKRYTGEEIRDYIAGDLRDKDLEQTIFSQGISQPLLFSIEYALCRMMDSWGVQPSYMIGHSIGEYVAAQLAGVFNLEEVLGLVALRGKLMEKLPPGIMLYVPMEEQELRSIMPSEVSIAIVNEPGCVVAGTEEDISEFEILLKSRRTITMRLEISHAGHSSLLEPMLIDFRKALNQITLKAPSKPFISNLTGTWIRADQATDPQYWVDHIKSTVRLSDGMKKLMDIENACFIEIGPGNTLSSTLSRLSTEKQRRVSSLSQSKNSDYSEEKFILNKLGQLWAWGVDINWESFYKHRNPRNRISLPTYPFERRLFKLDELDLSKLVHDPKKRDSEFTNWFYSQEWMRKGNAKPIDFKTMEKSGCIFLNHGKDKGVSFRNKLEAYFNIFGGDSEVQDPDFNYYTNLFEVISERETLPENIIFFVDVEATSLGLETFNEVQKTVFYPLLSLIKACGNYRQQMRIVVVTNGLHDIVGTEDFQPMIAPFLGLVKVVNQEYGHVKCSSIDFEEFGNGMDQNVIRLVTEILNPSTDRIIAFRGAYKWVQTFERCVEPQIHEQTSRFKQKGTYLMLGGLGNVGFVIGEYLAKNYGANLIMTGRSILPEKEDWVKSIDTENNADKVNSRLMKLTKLEELGARVNYHAVDITDKEQMKEMLEDSILEFDQIDGVIYCVTNIDEGQKAFISEISEEQIESQFNTKVRGLLVLHELTQDMPIDFCLLMSSSASVLGGLGFLGYSAGNIFMDYFSQYQNQKGYGRYISYNSSGWMHYNDQLEVPRYDKSEYNFKMTIDEGCEAIETVLKYREASQMIAYLSDFDYQLNNWVNIDSIDIEEEKPKEEWLATRPTLLNEYVAPENETQQQLSELWCGIFGFENVGITDDFFDLGGDSLKAIKLISRIENKLGKSILLKELLEGRTIENIAAVINSKSTAIYQCIPQSEKKEFYSLSSAQKRLYFLQKTQPESIAYNEQILIEIEGELNAKKVEEIVNKLIERHEVLRTSFVEYDGVPYQKIVSDTTVKVELKKGGHNVDQLILDFIRPFDLQQPPFLRVLLVEMEKNKHIMMLDQHHILTDGISFYIFKREFYTLINGQELSINQFNYKDFSEWQSRQLKQGQLKKQEEYWNDKFCDGFQNSELAKNEIPDSSGEQAAVILSEYLGKQTTTRFMDILKTNKTTIFNGLLTVLNVLLNKVSRKDQINIVSPVLGRKREELQDILGIFINMVVLSNQVVSDISFEELLSSVTSNTLEAFENDEYPFEELVKKIKQKSKDLSPPEFDVLFTIKNLKEDEQGEAEEYNGDLQFKYYDLNVYQPKYGMEVAFEETVDDINILFIYDSSVYSKLTATKMKDYFFLILNRILDDPKVLINKIVLESGITEVEDEKVDSLFESFDF